MPLERTAHVNVLLRELEKRGAVPKRTKDLLELTKDFAQERITPEDYYARTANYPTADVAKALGVPEHAVTRARTKHAPGAAGKAEAAKRFGDKPKPGVSDAKLAELANDYSRYDMSAADFYQATKDNSAADIAKLLGVRPEAVEYERKRLVHSNPAPTKPGDDPNRPKVKSDAEVMDALGYAQRGKRGRAASDRILAQHEAQKKAAAEYDARKAAEASTPTIAEQRTNGLHPHRWGDPVTVNGKRGSFDRYETQPDGSVKAIVGIGGRDTKVDPAKMSRDLSYAPSSSPSANTAAPTRANPSITQDSGYYRVSWKTPGGNERFYTARPPLVDVPGAPNSEWRVIDGTEASGKPVHPDSELHHHIVSSVKANAGYRDRAVAPPKPAEAPSLPSAPSIDAPGNAGRAEAAKRFGAAVTPPASAVPDSPRKTLTNPADEVDKLTTRATALMESGDYEQADKLFAQALDIDRARQAKEAKSALAKTRREARRDAANREKWAEVSKRIENGDDPVTAEAEVFGRSEKSILNRDFMALSRRNGYSGTRAQIIKRMHAEFAAEQYLRAEPELRSAGPIKKQYSGRYSTLDLWTVNDATARKIMTEEMAAWFDANGGRVDRARYEEMVLSGGLMSYSGRQDYLQ